MPMNQGKHRAILVQEIGEIIKGGEEMKGLLKVLCMVFLALLLSPIVTSAIVINDPPVADAGSDQTVEVGKMATLDGSKSSASEGFALTSYNWSWVSKPSGSSAEIADPGAPITSFTPDLPGAYVAQLIVTEDDADQPSEPDTTTIQAESGKTPLETAIEAIEQLQTEIDSLPRSKFRYVLSKRLLTLELNLVIASLEMGRYRIALTLLKNILPTTDGCLKNNVPDRQDWIVACDAQAIVYWELQEIITMVKGMR
jgi:hypothetical protein